MPTLNAGASILAYVRLAPLSLAALFFPAMLLAACGGDDEPSRTSGTAAATFTSTSAGPVPAVGLQLVAKGFSEPTFVTNAGDGSGRLFVLEKAGVIRIVKDGQVQAEPFLDIHTLVDSEATERGLLGLAFHPRFEQNGRFFVAYTASNSQHADTLAEYHVATGAAKADPASGKVMLAIPDKYPNHNGGMLAFGPDGYLYFGTGDGGGAGDPDRTAQDLGAYLGKILRLDVDGGAPYAIPKDNPFAAKAGAKPEVWAYGLRNPWRFSFDRKTGDVWIGDVGQDEVEEVDLQLAASKGGENYGWSALEGTHCFRPKTACDASGKVPPVFEYTHDEGCSITGGYVYRGAAVPALAGFYLFTDYCTAELRALRGDGAGYAAVDLGALKKGPSSFGEDEAGEVYVLSYSEGAVYRLVGVGR